MKVISFDHGVMVVGQDNAPVDAPAPSFNATPEQQEAYLRAATSNGLDESPAVVPNTPEPEPEPIPEFEPEAGAQAEAKPAKKAK